MGRIVTFKVTDYIEPDLVWEEEECRKLNVRFACYQLKDAPPSQIIEAVDDADIVLVNMARFSAGVIAGLRSAKLILRHGIGYDNVDVAAATAQGIIFANEATASSQDVAEHAVMLILETYKKKNFQTRLLRRWIERQEWNSEEIAPLHRLSGKTLGILGCGRIGSLVLEKIKGFGVDILVCDPYLPKKRMKELGVKHTPFDELLERSDILTIHVPVTDETRGMLNKQALSRMKKTAVVINTARGPIIKTDDLIRALKDGQISGAGLDVFEHEPPAQNLELLHMDNVIISPHIAWYSEEGGWDVRRMIMDDVRAYLAGKLPRFVVNREVLNSPKLRFKVI